MAEHSKPPTFRERLSRLSRSRWLTRTKPAPFERDVLTVIGALATGDELLARKLADVAREHYERHDKPSRQWDRVIAWLDTTDVDADELAQAILVQTDPETGAVHVPALDAETMAAVRWALEDEGDGEARLRRVLGILWRDSARADAALKYRHMRAKRS